MKLCLNCKAKMDSNFLVDVRILKNNASIRNAVPIDMKKIVPVVHCLQPYGLMIS